MDYWTVDHPQKILSKSQLFSSLSSWTPRMEGLGVWPISFENTKNSDGSQLSAPDSNSLPEMTSEQIGQILQILKKKCSILGPFLVLHLNWPTSRQSAGIALKTLPIESLQFSTSKLCPNFFLNSEKIHFFGIKNKWNIFVFFFKSKISFEKKTFSENFEKFRKIFFHFRNYFFSTKK